MDKVWVFRTLYTTVQILDIKLNRDMGSKAMHLHTDIWVFTKKKVHVTEKRGNSPKSGNNEFVGTQWYSCSIADNT